MSRNKIAVAIGADVSVGIVPEADAAAGPVLGESGREIQVVVAVTPLAQRETPVPRETPEQRESEYQRELAAAKS